MTGPYPARLHILLAREAAVGLVIRRGPSKQVCTLLWDRRTDGFTVGQWLKGRIYARRSDLSPDGKYFVYFASNGFKQESATKGSWTAVSHAPYLKAISLYGKGDAWNGGGLFTASNRLWLNDSPSFAGHFALRESPLVSIDRRYKPAGGLGSECQGVYYPRLLRDGWIRTEERAVGEWHDITVFELALPGGWTLRKLAHGQVGPPTGKGCYWDEHELVNAQRTLTLACRDWEWADHEPTQDRLVWAEAGRLWAGKLDAQGLTQVTLLHDFNELTFERLQAPY